MGSTPALGQQEDQIHQNGVCLFVLANFFLGGKRFPKIGAPPSVLGVPLKTLSPQTHLKSYDCLKCCCWSLECSLDLFVQRCPFLHSPAFLWNAAVVHLLSLVDIPKGARSRRERRCPNGLQLCSWALRLILKIPLCRKRDQTLKTIFKKFWGSKKDPFPVWA